MLRTPRTTINVLGVLFFVISKRYNYELVNLFPLLKDYEYIKTCVISKPPPNIKTNATTGHTKRNQCE